MKGKTWPSKQGFKNLLKTWPFPNSSKPSPILVGLPSINNNSLIQLRDEIICQLYEGNLVASNLLFILKASA